MARLSAARRPPAAQHSQTVGTRRSAAQARLTLTEPPHHNRPTAASEQHHTAAHGRWQTGPWSVAGFCERGRSTRLLDEPPIAAERVAASVHAVGSRSVAGFSRSVARQVLRTLATRRVRALAVPSASQCGAVALPGHCSAYATHHLTGSRPLCDSPTASRLNPDPSLSRNGLGRWRSRRWPHPDRRPWRPAC